MNEKRSNMPLPPEEGTDVPPDTPEGLKKVVFPPISDEERDRIRQEAGARAIVSHRISSGSMDYRPGSTTVSKGGKRRRSESEDRD